MSKNIVLCSDENYDSLTENLIYSFDRVDDNFIFYLYTFGYESKINKENVKKIKMDCLPGIPLPHLYKTLALQNALTLVDEYIYVDSDIIVSKNFNYDVLLKNVFNFPKGVKILGWDDPCFFWQDPQSGQRKELDCQAMCDHLNVEKKQKSWVSCCLLSVNKSCENFINELVDICMDKNLWFLGEDEYIVNLGDFKIKKSRSYFHCGEETPYNVLLWKYNNNQSYYHENILIETKDINTILKIENNLVLEEQIEPENIVSYCKDSRNIYVYHQLKDLNLRKNILFSLNKELDSRFSIINFLFEKDNFIKIFFKLNDSFYENKKLKISLYDSFFKHFLHSYEGFFDQKFEYWVGSHNVPFSKWLDFEVEIDNNKIFKKTIFLHKDLDLSILDRFPFLINYRNDNLERGIIEEIFIKNSYENSFVKLKQNDVVVDIGSNLGAFIYYALQKKSSKIYSCEPNQRCLNVLKKHFEIYPNIFINDYAISDKNEQKQLLFPIEVNLTSGGNFISDNEYINWHSKDLRKEEVKGITFLDFIKINNINYIDFLKVDCEGGEHYIFSEKNSSFIKNNVNKISLEYHGEHKHLLNFFEKNNFRWELVALSDSIGIIYAKNKKISND